MLTGIGRLFKDKAKQVLFCLEKKSSDKYGLKGDSELDYKTFFAVNALIYDIGFASITWKLPGVQTEEAKEMIIEKDKLSILLNTNYIIIDGIEFYSWKDNSNKTRYKDMGDYVSVYIYRRN